MFFRRPLINRSNNLVSLVIGVSASNQFPITTKTGEESESSNRTFVTIGRDCMWDRIDIAPDGRVSVFCYPRPQAVKGEQTNGEGPHE